MYFDPEGRNDDKLGKVRDPIAKAAKYVKTRSPKEKLVMLCAIGLLVSKRGRCESFKIMFLCLKDLMLP